MAQTIGEKNPFRYRGYYYDSESGFYYLNSRYYDLDVGRFLNADDVDVLEIQTDLHDKNLFAYCDNNPVVRVDSGGDVWDIIDIAFAAWSWTDFIMNPSLGNMGWALLDTVALLPLIPSAGYITRTSKIVNKASKAKKAAKSFGTLKKASGSAFKAARKVGKFSVSSKHLSSAGGRWAKFATNSKSQVNRWVKEGLKSKNAIFHANAGKEGSYFVVTNLGRKIGTKGQTSIKVVFDSSGNIWTAMPV